MSTRLNPTTVRARRLELGLSERKMAALTGLSQTVIRNIEAGASADLTLRDLDRVAATLATTTGALLDTGAADASTTTSPTSNPVVGPATLVDHLAEHVGVVGALLYDIDRLIPVESLATTLDLDLDQTHQVLDELDRRARSIGMLVHRLGNSVKLWRPQDAVPHAVLRSTWRAHLARRGLDLGQVRLLHQARDGRRSKSLTNDQQVTAAELVNAALLVRTPSGGTTLSDDVRYSLLLD